MAEHTPNTNEEGTSENFFSRLNGKPLKKLLYIFLVVIAFIFSFTFYFLSILLFILLAAGVIWGFNRWLKKTEQGSDSCINTLDRKKSLIQYIIVPMFVAFGTYIVTDRIYGHKEVILIGISDASYSDTIDFAKIFNKGCISKANEILGGYHPGLQFDMVTVSGDYEEIWEALEDGRIDMAFTSPYNTAHKIQTDKTFDDKFEIIGGKYTAIGKDYRSGFLMKKCLKKHFTNIESIALHINSDSCLKMTNILLSKESLSTSGYQVPIWFLNNYCHKKNWADILPSGSLQDNIEEIIDGVDSNKITICAFSNDMWFNLKKYSPKLANKLHFVPISYFHIPMDPAIVLKDKWKELNSPRKRILDFITLKNTGFTTGRHNLIKKSLRYIMDDANNKVRYVSLYNKLHKLYKRQSIFIRLGALSKQIPCNDLKKFLEAQCISSTKRLKIIQQ